MVVGVLGGGVVVAVAALVVGGGDLDLPRLVLGAAAGVALVSAAMALVRSILTRPRDRSRRATAGAAAGHLAHAGLGLLLLGVTGTATGATERVAVRPGDTVEILGATVEYRGVHVDDEPDGAGTQAVVADVRAAGHDLAPALVAYPERRQLLAETSLVSTPRRDVQVALRDARDNGSAVLEVGVHPLQVWVWWGALALVGAGLLAMLTRTLPTPSVAHDRAEITVVEPSPAPVQASPARSPT